MLAKHKAKWAILNPGETMSAPRTTRRFKTTSLSGTESVASRRGEVPDRATMVKELEERKRNNTRSSLFFGSTKTLYESDAMRRQKDIFGLSPSRMEEKHNKELKRELTATHFILGDDPVVYKRTSTLPDPTGSMSKYTGVLNAEVRDLIKNARLHFGSTPTVYRSMARDQMDSKLLDEENMEEQREKNRMLKVFLTGTHFSLGDEDVDWITDHRRGFQYDPKKAKMAENKGIAKELKEDLRRTHFSLGNDQCDWQTDTMRWQKAWTVATSEEMKAQRERNKELRRHLQGNSYEIGTDEDYM